MRKSALALTALAATGLIVVSTARLAQASDPSVGTATPATHQTATEVCVLPPESIGGKTIAQWRAQGPEGLPELAELVKPSHKAYVKARQDTGLSESKELQAKLANAEAELRFFDQVAQQRDAYFSKLYWYTNLDEAIKEAKRTQKPILSLRMLGKLCDEYSCANSRFFRTALYSDAKVSDELREKFVLHWQSVRPVPVITIDMGDGRSIKRTITGNSAHYVLDPNGRVVDCIPGLYGSGTFRQAVAVGHSIAGSLKDVDDPEFAKQLKEVHTMLGDNLDRTWRAIADAALNQAKDPKVKIPNARQAGRLAVGKMIVEAPLVNAVLLTPVKATNDHALWERVAQAYAADAKLGGGSKTLMRLKTTSAEEAGQRAHGKYRVEDPLLRMVRNFENAIALDTARNEHLLHREIYQWFTQADAPLDLDELNARVYAELFLTPDSDPWLGLVPADAYSALENRGLVQ